MGDMPTSVGVWVEGPSTLGSMVPRFIIPLFLFGWLMLVFGSRETGGSRGTSGLAFNVPRVEGGPTDMASSAMCGQRRLQTRPVRMQFRRLSDRPGDRNRGAETSTLCVTHSSAGIALYCTLYKVRPPSSGKRSSDNRLKITEKYRKVSIISGYCSEAYPPTYNLPGIITYC